MLVPHVLSLVPVLYHIQIVLSAFGRLVFALKLFQCENQFFTLLVIVGVSLLMNKGCFTLNTFNETFIDKDRSNCEETP